MTKKSASSSNVPQHGTTMSSSKTKNSLHTNVGGSHSGTGSTVLNSKHLHNQSHQQKPHKPRENETPTGNNASELMKKLSEAVQKQQKEKESSGWNNSSTSNVGDATEKKRSRKGTAPAGLSVIQNMTMQNNLTYAGAAFDRAPPATSFPIPSFIKPNRDSTLSQSCPLPTSLESSSLKTLSMSEFFPPAEQKDKKKLDSLTDDLRKLLNLK